MRIYRTVLTAMVCAVLCAARASAGDTPPGQTAKTAVVDPYYAKRQSAAKQQPTLGADEAMLDDEQAFPDDLAAGGPTSLTGFSAPGAAPPSMGGYGLSPATLPGNSFASAPMPGAYPQAGPMGPMGPAAPMGPQGPMGPGAIQLQSHLMYGGAMSAGVDWSMAGAGPGGGVYEAPLPTDSILWGQIHNGQTVWASFDYLGWWMKGDRVPPLITTSPIFTPQVDAGVLGEPGTRVLFGGNRILDDFRSGGRVVLGAWLSDNFLGVEGHYYALGRERNDFLATSSFTSVPTGQILARPFFDESQGIQNSLVIAYPDFNFGGFIVDLNGRVQVHANSDVQSAGLGLKRLLAIDFPADHRMFAVGGYRFMRIDEGLQIQHSQEPVGGPFLPGTFINGRDNFATSNEFQGGDVGLTYEMYRGPWVVTATAKLGLGNMHQVVRIDGSTTTFDGVNTTVENHGLLAQPSNMGKFSQDKFSFIPEAELKLAYQVSTAVRATFGYNFTYVTGVLRPGSEIDFGVNPTQNGMLVGPLRPLPRLDSTSLWLQGITAGLEFRY